MEETTQQKAIAYRNYNKVRWQVEYNISHGMPARLLNMNTGEITVVPPLFDLDAGTRCYNTFWIKSRGRRIKYLSSNYYGEQIQEYLTTFGLNDRRVNFHLIPTKTKHDLHDYAPKSVILKLAERKFIPEDDFDKTVLQDNLNQMFGVLEAININKVLAKINKYNKVYTWYDEFGLKIEPLPIINPELSTSSFIEFGRHWYALYDLARPETDRDAQVVATMTCYYLSQNIKPSLTPRQLIYQHIQMEDHDMSSAKLFKKCYGS